MEGDNQKSPIEHNVHRVLAHSYTVYFILFLFGIVLDVIFKFKIFSSSFAVPIGLALLVIASFLILWAQKTTRKGKGEHVTKETFCKGPYCYTRHPTYLGLFLLLIGFGIIANALFVILATLISFLVAKFIFIEKEEKILTKKYGAPYLEYKRAVKF